MNNNAITANIPFQLVQLIDAMLNSKENVHLRGNYRARLDLIQHEITKAITRYDQEVMLSDASRGKKKRA